MANTYLTRTPSSAGNRQKWTWSAWIKRSVLGTDQSLFSAYGHANNNFKVNIADTDQLSMRFYNGSEYQLGLNRVMRDTSAWYHVVIVVDTTLASGGDRFKIYINGVRESSFAAATDPTRNLQMSINDTSQPMQIGRFNTGAYFNGSMSHVHFSDGSALAPTVFGSTDSTTGEWKINTSPSFTPGTNGFTILKDGNGVADVSANSNNFTIGVGSGGGLSKTEDCPSNVFATLNPLDNKFPQHTFTYGNTTSKSKTGSSAPYTFVTGSLGMTSGKYYWEAKLSALQTSVNKAWTVGITSSSTTSTTTSLGSQSTQYAYNCNTGVIYNAGSTNYGAGCTLNDILGVAVDMDNNKIYWSINGTWQNSGNPASGSTGTGAFSITAPTGNIGAYLPAWSYYQDDNWGEVQFNFGNGYFANNPVSSAGTNASGNGIFEYDVPSGYTALSTKGLNT